MSTSRRADILLLVALCVFVVATLTWASVAAVAPGRVVPTGQMKVIRSFKQDKIRPIVVEEGSLVERDDVLIELDTPWHPFRERMIVLREDIRQPREHRARHTLLSPVDSVVQDLAVHMENGVVERGARLMVIVPRNAGIRAETFVANTDIGSVKPGTTPATAPQSGDEAAPCSRPSPNLTRPSWRSRGYESNSCPACRRRLRSSPATSGSSNTFCGPFRATGNIFRDK